MKRLLFVLLCVSALGQTALRAQVRTVQNRPYCDLRPIHFGVIVGTHMQDIEFENVGPQTFTNEDGTSQLATITTDQDRWDAGFTVGVLAEFRLSTNFQFRAAPAMYFGTRHLTFHNFTDLNADGEPREMRQNMKTAYISSAFDLIFAAPRFNNHRPYIMAGLNPMINLSRKSDDYLRLKPYDVFAEIGVGLDFYLPFFKLRPELKFMYSLTNALDTNHPNELRDKSMVPYAASVSKAHTKIIALSFYFE